MPSKAKKKGVKKKVAKKKVAKKKVAKRNRLFRYTSLPVLLDILSKRELTLLNPASWDDRNDSCYLEVYKKKRELKTLLAICFTTGAETYHHWKVFSSGSSGVCIQFNKEKLLEYLDVVRGIKYGAVKYRLIRKLLSKSPELEELPFLKRQPFKDEKEFRIIYKNKSKEIEMKPVGIGLECIEIINLSPWIPDPVSDTIKDIIKDIEGCSEIRVSKTTLVDNKLWRNIAMRKHGKTI